MTNETTAPEAQTPTEAEPKVIEVVERSLEDSIMDYVDESSTKLPKAEKSLEELAYGGQQNDKVETPSGESKTSEDAAGEAAPRPAPSGDTKDGKEVGGAEQAVQPGAQESDPDYVPQGRITADAKGNLVDETGRLVAKAGAERRWFEKAVSTQEYVGALKTDLQRYEQKLGEYQKYVEHVQKHPHDGQSYGLNRDDTAHAMNLMANYRRDPVNTLRYMLTEAANEGHNIKDLVGGLDTAIIKRMIQEISPAEQRQQQQPQVQEQQDVYQHQANKQLAEFYMHNPEARIHEDSLAAILEARPDLSLENGWLVLQNHALKNGYDLRLPLKPQVEQRKQGASTPPTQQPVTQPVQQQQQVPLRTGRSTDTAIELNDTLISAADARNADIVKAAMKENGIWE